MNLTKLYDDVVADGKIDTEEVNQMGNIIFNDGVVDDAEVDFLFKVNDAVSGNDNCDEWEGLFVKAVASNIMADGVIDEDEEIKLMEKLNADGQIDAVEKALLVELKAQNNGLPDSLEALLAA